GAEAQVREDEDVRGEAHWIPDAPRRLLRSPAHLFSRRARPAPALGCPRFPSSARDHQVFDAEHQVPSGTEAHLPPCFRRGELLSPGGPRRRETEDHHASGADPTQMSTHHRVCRHGPRTPHVPARFHEKVSLSSSYQSPPEPAPRRSQQTSLIPPATY